ncbi:MAG: dihydrolipoyl dehydrogenase [Planctomycetota bacterium]
MAAESFDLVVIGAGPGGYTGAIRASQLGLKVAIVEKRTTLGGTCLNVGCIPSKALLDSSEHFIQAKESFAEHGIKCDPKLDLAAMLGRKDKVVESLTKGIDYLMGKHQIVRYNGLGRFADPRTVEVVEAGKVTHVLSARHVMIATGSEVSELPSLPLDGKNVISSTEALALKEVPGHLCVVGGGVIGLELGSVWRRLGSQVTVVEYLDRLVPSADAKMAKDLQRTLKKQGFHFLLGCEVKGARKSTSGLEVEYVVREGGHKEKLDCDIILVAVGRKPHTLGLQLEKAGLKVDPKGRIPVDAHLQTTVKGIYAVGDVVEGPMLAHKAEEEGVAVAEIIAGRSGHVNYAAVPSVVYTHPELAWVGLTEEESKAKGLEVNVGTFPFAASGRARALGETEGSVKVIAQKGTDKLLGVHILGPRASDLIAEAVVVMEFGGSSEDLARSFHAHPTLSEALREAALAVDKRSRQS